ncbi:Proto-oncogene tyrosine-protein kinase ROS [Amphibalanus amphitrite]|uniref:Proto-oncogene tyrosine-protein kinase ROS n=1 Tax=Amphibalanus amphitrite TaxID=1232801 RepID=A0A6A4V6D7_AMPAM|nr:Proto-oncogene tyrosine-protein kinase ROS [Amphibalanus amphitrite]
MTGRLFCCALLLALCRVTVSLPEVSAQNEEKCEQLCVKNQGRGSNLETSCDESCRLEQCNKGCAGRNRSLESSCKQFCMDEGPSSQQGERWYCVIGCNIAVSRYVQQLREELQLGAPTLVPDSLTADSVTIRWLAPPLPHVMLLVQYKYSDLPGEWIFYQPDVKLNASQVTITGLKPYTKYQFRVLWAVAASQEPLPGAPSHPISTLARGRPASAPEALTVAAPDAHHVSLRWLPPSFPGGPLVSYLLVVRAGGQRTAAEIDPHLTSHVLGGLQPNTNYTVTVSAINKDGAGPPAESWVRTPALAAEVSTQERPMLIIGSGDLILRLKMNVTSAPRTVYRADKGVNITGTAMDVSSAQLFLATSAGRVLRLPLDGSASRPVDVTPVGLAGQPALLALDWLAGALYGLVAAPGGDWTVQRWLLDDPKASDTGLRFAARPAHMAVDPQNGYFYYSVSEPSPDAGLFRCSFDNMTSAERVASGADLNFATFVIDHTNFSVLVPGREKNTVFALSMISWSRADIRSGAVRPQYDGMLALAEHARTLCWSRGQHIYLETYRADRRAHYANQFMFSQTRLPVISLHVQHPASQPRPAPASPPRELQVVFHSGRALARWQPPALSGLAGPAAWSHWTYQLRLTDAAGRSRDVENITGTEVTVEKLAPDTQYTLQVRALSVSGLGPWSAPFRGRTLEHHLDASGPFLLWSTEVGLLRSDVIGDRPTVLVSRASFNASDKSGIHVSDLTWCDDIMYLATNDSRVYSHDLRTGELRQLGDAVQATALAVDWIGRRLYWSSPKQQLIYGAPLPDDDVTSKRDVTAGTPLPFFTAARHLRVDALRGVLYWATGHTVEASYLNGERRRHLYKTGIFSGKQVRKYS